MEYLAEVFDPYGRLTSYTTYYRLSDAVYSAEKEQEEGLMNITSVIPNAMGLYDKINHEMTINLPVDK